MDRGATGSRPFFWKILFVRGFADLDGTLVVIPGEHRHRLQRVNSLREISMVGNYATMSIVLIDFMDGNCK
jgi:hypothetical protein